MSSGCETPVVEFRIMWLIPSLSLLLGPPQPGVAVPDRVPSMGQIELFNHLTECKQITDVE